MGWNIDHWGFNSFDIDRNNTCRIGKKVFFSRRLFWAPFMMKITQRDMVEAKGASATVIKKQWLQQEIDCGLTDATHCREHSTWFQYCLARLPNRYWADTSMIFFNAIFIKRLYFSKKIFIDVLLPGWTAACRCCIFFKENVSIMK